jgi:polar amino acid transport system substrate-binding protein
MKQLFKLVVVALIAAVGTSGAWAGDSLDRVMNNNLLKVATDANWPPQSFMNKNNEMDGFDVSVAREIAKRLGVKKVEFVTPAWDIITAGNWHGRWDISVGSMAPTKERAKVLSFPGVYYYQPTGFAVHKDAPYQDKTELNGKKIGATTASTLEYYLKKDLTIDAEGVPPFEYDVTPGRIVSYKDSNTALDDLRLGNGVRLDAVISGYNTLQAAIENGYPIRIVGTPAFYEPLSVAIDRGDQEFHDKLAAILKELHEDGTLTALSMKWYSFDYTKTAK